MKNITVNGVEYTPIPKENSQRVISAIETYKLLLRLYRDEDYLCPTSLSIMIHDWGADEINRDDWDASGSSGGGTVFHHKEYPNLVIFTNEPWKGDL